MAPRAGSGASAGGRRAGFGAHFEAAAASGLLALLRLLPYAAAWRAAEALGLACATFVPKWADVADGNLRLALPDLDAASRRSIRRGAFRNLGRVALALAKAPTWTERQTLARVDFDGLERFRAAEARGRGVLLLTAHLGNWELGALAHGAVVGPLHVVARPVGNPLVDRLIESRRQAHGNRVIRKRSAAREVLRVLRANGTVGILADQNTLPDEAVFVDFFGRAAAANKAFAQLAMRSGAAVVPAVAWWDPATRRHVVEYGAPIDVVRTGDSAADVIVNTQRFQEALEERVRRHPEQWLWIHRRWKTRPPSAPPAPGA